LYYLASIYNLEAPTSLLCSLFLHIL